MCVYVCVCACVCVYMCVCEGENVVEELVSKYFTKITGHNCYHGNGTLLEAYRQCGNPVLRA